MIRLCPPGSLFSEDLGGGTVSAGIASGGGAGGPFGPGVVASARPSLSVVGDDDLDDEQGTRCAGCDRPRHLTDGLCRECSPDRCPGINRDGSRCRVLGPFCPRHGRR